MLNAKHLINNACYHYIIESNVYDGSEPNRVINAVGYWNAKKECFIEISNSDLVDYERPIYQEYREDGEIWCRETIINAHLLYREESLVVL